MGFKNKIGLYFFIILTAFFGFKFGFIQTVSGLDASWAYAINYVSATSSQIWGADVFFTYGPLGFLSAPFLIGQNVYIAYFYYALVFSVLFGSIFYIAKNIKDVWAKFGLMLLFFILTVLTSDIFLFVNVFLSVLYWYSDKNKSKAANYVFFSLAAIFSILSLFIKTNLGVTSIITLFVAFLAVSFENKKINWKQVILGLFYLCAISVLMVKLYFGDVSVFFNWLKVSLVVASGFTEAMVRIGKWAEQFFLLSALIIIGLVLYLFKTNLKSKSASLSIILFPYLFFQFKSGFVRQDLHMLNFYWAVLFIAAMILIFFESREKKDAVILSVVCFLALILPLQYNNFNLGNNFFTSTEYLLKVDSNGIKLPSDSLPEKWVKLIGKNTVEILPREFSYAQKYNLNIQFNPILQLYSVYTQELDRISADSYTLKKAPQFIVIHDFVGIDKRNMFIDTPATWQSIKENYETVDSKDGKLLLRKKLSPEKIKYETFSKEKYEFNRQIEIPQGSKKALINAQLSPIGALTLFVFRLSPMRIYILDNDNQRHTYKLIRGVLGNGLYTVDLVTNADELRVWLNDECSDKKIKGFTLQVRHRIFYKNKIEIEWQK